MNFTVYEIKEVPNTQFFSYQVDSKTGKGTPIKVTRKDIFLQLSKNPKWCIYDLCESLGYTDISKLKKSELVNLLKRMENKPIDFK